MLMEGTRDELRPGAGFADDQRRRVGVGHPAHQREQAGHCRTASDEIGEGGSCDAVAAHPLELVAQPAVLDRALERDHQLPDL
jgi:hypothetical protein